MLKPQREEIETPWFRIFQPLGMEASAEAAVACTLGPLLSVT